MGRIMSEENKKLPEIYEEAKSSIDKAFATTQKEKKQVENQLVNIRKQKDKFLSQFESAKSKMTSDSLDKITQSLQKMEEIEKELQKSIEKLSHNAEVLDNRSYSLEEEITDAEIDSFAVEDNIEKTANEFDGLDDFIRNTQRKLNELEAKTSNDDNDELKNMLEEDIKFANDRLMALKKDLSEAIQNGMDEAFIDSLKQSIGSEEKFIKDTQKNAEQYFNTLEENEKQDKIEERRHILETFSEKEKKN